jgi:hypothetical protein
MGGISRKCGWHEPCWLPRLSEQPARLVITVVGARRWPGRDNRPSFPGCEVETASLDQRRECPVGLTPSVGLR